jgi:hypothetical protein
VLDGFTATANRWSSVLLDNITVNINIVQAFARRHRPIVGVLCKRLLDGGCGVARQRDFGG